MDTLTHALSGALVARAAGAADRAALKRRIAAAFLACASPDLDFVIGFFGPLRYLELHRGPTHSLLLLPLWALLYSWILAKLLREPGGWRALYGVTAMGIGLHVAGDLITSFGTMIFWPLSDWRAGLGTTFIVDLWFSGIILAGLIASWAWRRSRLPAVAASVALLAYVGFQGVLKHQALEFAQRHARASGLEDASLRAEPRPVSPFNWTVYVTSGDVHRFAHVNLRREAPRAVSPQDGFIARLDAPYLPLAQARWESATRFGNDAEARLAREAWASPALASFRWFAEVPAYDGTTQGSTCVWFRDLRFEAPGRGDPPFRYGACRDTGTSPWRAFMRVGETGRRALD